MKKIIMLVIAVVMIAGCSTMSLQPDNAAELETMRSAIRIVTFGVLYKNPELAGDVVTVTEQAISMVDNGEITSIDMLESYLAGLARGHRDEALAVFMISEGKRLLSDIITQRGITMPSEIERAIITLLREVNVTAKLLAGYSAHIDLDELRRSLERISDEAAERTDIRLGLK